MVVRNQTVESLVCPSKPCYDLQSQWLTAGNIYTDGPTSLALTFQSVNDHTDSSMGHKFCTVSYMTNTCPFPLPRTWDSCQTRPGFHFFFYLQGVSDV